ncbi:uncharacterized protein LOC113302619 [Papaver somniferum]|uniref:uncharacterized protein LOC113302619 n=1 Tax=Papaver somniferum TaxID=3469 RepID=UPI000E705CC5|nr:uncharacterized protein LOC113302619 [Papaver somniferum]
MDCISTSTSNGTSIRKFIRWKSFLLARRPFEMSSYLKRNQLLSKGIRVHNFSKSNFLISIFVALMVSKFLLVPMLSHCGEMFRLVYNLITDAKSCQLLVFFVLNVIIIAISFSNSKPFEEDQDISSLNEPHSMSVQNEKNVQKQEEKNDVVYEEILLTEEHEEITTLLDNVEEGYVSDYENDSENGDCSCDSSSFGDSDNEDCSDDSSNFCDNGDDNDDLNIRAEEFIARINERWRAERLREYNLYIVN